LLEHHLITSKLSDFDHTGISVYFITTFISGHLIRHFSVFAFSALSMLLNDFQSHFKLLKFDNEMYFMNFYIGYFMANKFDLI